MLKKQQGGSTGSEQQEVQRLRSELEKLREQLDRPGTPRRSQTIVGGEPGRVDIHVSMEIYIYFCIKKLIKNHVIQI